MVRINIGILGISELKWMGMSEFNSDNQFLRRNRVALIVYKEPEMQYLGATSKMTQCSFPRQVIQHHSNLDLRHLIPKKILKLISSMKT